MTASLKGSAMKLARLARRLFVGTVAASTAAALALTVTSSGAWATGGSTAPSGTRSLAQVLTRDTSGFDRKPYDFDIITQPALTVLSAKPNSPVKVLTDGTDPLNAFLPTDAAIQLLVQEIT